MDTPLGWNVVSGLDVREGVEGRGGDAGAGVDSVDDGERLGDASDKSTSTGLPPWLTSWLGVGEELGSEVAPIKSTGEKGSKSNRSHPERRCVPCCDVSGAAVAPTTGSVDLGGSSTLGGCGSIPAPQELHSCSASSSISRCSIILTASSEHHISNCIVSPLKSVRTKPPSVKLVSTKLISACIDLTIRQWRSCISIEEAAFMDSIWSCCCFRSLPKL